MKNYQYAVGKIRKIDGNVITANVMKYRVSSKFGNPIPTSLSKWKEKNVILNTWQLERFKTYEDEDTRREYLSRILNLC